MQRHATATHSLLLTCRRLWPPVFVFSAVSLSVCLSACLCAWQRCSYVTGDVTASVSQVPRRTLLVVPDCRVNGRAGSRGSWVSYVHYACTQWTDCSGARSRLVWWPTEWLSDWMPGTPSRCGLSCLAAITHCSMTILIPKIMTPGHRIFAIRSSSSSS